MYNLISLLILISASFSSYAQELNCVVKVEAAQIETSERRIFSEMEIEFAKFLNDREWGDKRFENNERINCGMNITLELSPSSGSYSASVQVISARPIYNSSYEAVVINFADRDFNFTYSESQPLDFNENSFLSNITSMLGYYAYIMLAYDSDSFEKLGGQEYYDKAWQVVNAAQQSGFGGWDQFNSVRNRYWLSENSLNQVMQPMREALYEYHRLGLDLMVDDPEEARKAMLEALKKVQQVNQVRPRSIMIISFLDAKEDEIISAFSNGDMGVRKEVHNILKALNPANTDKFKKILSN